jgi:hypothetical protein
MSSPPYPPALWIVETHVHRIGSAICRFDVALQLANHVFKHDQYWSKEHPEHLTSFKIQADRFFRWVQTGRILTRGIDTFDWDMRLTLPKTLMSIREELEKGE